MQILRVTDDLALHRLQIVQLDKNQSHIDGFERFVSVTNRTNTWWNRPKNSKRKKPKQDAERKEKHDTPSKFTKFMQILTPKSRPILKLYKRKIKLDESVTRTYKIEGMATNKITGSSLY